MIDALRQRMERAAESLLDNETLTAELGEPAAGALLDWGLACAELVVRETAQLDDETAETFMNPKLRAVRQLMRSVNQWVTERQEIDAEATEDFFSQVVERAAKIYPAYQPPEIKEQQRFLRESLTDEPAQWIVNLRKLIEESHPSSPDNIISS